MIPEHDKEEIHPTQNFYRTELTTTTDQQILDRVEQEKAKLQEIKKLENLTKDESKTLLK